MRQDDPVQAAEDAATEPLGASAIWRIALWCASLATLMPVALSRCDLQEEAFALAGIFIAIMLVEIAVLVADLTTRGE